MGRDSGIEWTHHTFNPWRGCTKVSAGCANCYAETLSKRNPTVLGTWGPNGTRVVAAESYWREPLKWNAEAGRSVVIDHAGRRVLNRLRVFCASLADVFEDRPELVAPRTRLFDVIRETPALDWLLLTKRPQNVLPAVEQSALSTLPSATCDMLNCWMKGAPPENVWLGVSVEDQAAANERIPRLLKTPAAVRFLSCEPLLGPVDLAKLWSSCDGSWFSAFHPEYCGTDGWGELHWVIVGGESGAGARPMHPDWSRSLRDQCQAAGVPFFHKQNGEFVSPGDPAFGTRPSSAVVLLRPDGTVVDPQSSEGRDENADVATMARVGKKAAGRLLDGRTWDEFPKPEAAHA